MIESFTMIAIIDYESGNLRSISKALEEVGARVKVTDNKTAIAKSKGIVLPGVGAFSHGMKMLKNKGLIPLIHDAIKEEKPFFGICLGLQLLFTESEEHGFHKGLGIIDGRVKRFSASVKIPHLGWNQVKIETIFKEKNRIFDNIKDNSYFYFVHSYYVEPEDKNIIAATTFYGKKFTSCIIKGNVWAVQFHPEKSSSDGLKILENFYKFVCGVNNLEGQKCLQKE